MPGNKPRGRDKGHYAPKGGFQDLNSVRGSGAILATCDNVRGREGTKEMLNILSDIIEEIDLEKGPPSSSSSSSSSSNSSVGVQSIQNTLEAELAAARESSKKAQAAIIGIDTGVKGLCLFRINRKDLSATDLCRRIFDKVRQEKHAICRYIIRLCPMEQTYYPDAPTSQSFLSEAMSTVFPTCMANLPVAEAAWQKVDDTMAAAAAAAKESALKSDTDNKNSNETGVETEKPEESSTAKRGREESGCIGEESDVKKPTTTTTTTTTTATSTSTDTTTSEVIRVDPPKLVPYDGPKRAIRMQITRRNNNNVTREHIQNFSYALCRPMTTVDYKDPDVSDFLFSFPFLSFPFLSPFFFLCILYTLLHIASAQRLSPITRSA